MNRGVHLYFLPPYSPNFNLIEEAFSFVRSFLWCCGEDFCVVVDGKDLYQVHYLLHCTLSEITPDKAMDGFITQGIYDILNRCMILYKCYKTCQFRALLNPHPCKMNQPLLHDLWSSCPSVGSCSCMFDNIHIDVSQHQDYLMVWRVHISCLWGCGMRWSLRGPWLGNELAV